MSLSTFLILSPFALDAAMTSPHMLSFAGREWYVKDSGLEKTAPGPCHWTSATQAIWSDRYGLHLTIRPRTGCSDWASTEAWSKESFGYGTFRFTVTGAYKHQDPQSTMGGFLWDDDTDDDPLPVNHWHREIDVEISKWGVAANPPVSFTIQPWSLDGTTRNPLASHLTRIDAATDSGGELGPEGGGACDAFGPGSFGGATIQTLTFVILWFPDQLRFAYFDGDIPMAQLASSKLKLLGSWNYMGAKPTPNFANPSLGVHMHLYVLATRCTKCKTHPPPSTAYPLPCFSLQATCGSATGAGFRITRGLFTMSSAPLTTRRLLLRSPLLSQASNLSD